MASSSFSDAPTPDSAEASAKSVTIVINDNGEIDYDEKNLQSIIGKKRMENLIFYYFMNQSLRTGYFI